MEYSICLGEMIFSPGLKACRCIFKANYHGMQLLQEYSEAFEGYLQSLIRSGQPESLYEPVRYILNLGGKRIRPVLCMMGYAAFAQDPGKALPVAASLEIFHNFTLMHDDIMDGADLRRGRETVHRKWSVNSAILSGDAMLILAYKVLLDAASDRRGLELLKIFTRIAEEVCQGQQWDMEFESREQVSEAEYLEMIRLKTAVLLGASVQMGALAAGAPEPTCAHLYHFAEKTGLAFQIQDDWLDLYGDMEKVGKVRGGDLIQKKKTFLVVHFLERAGNQDRIAFHRYFHDPAVPKEEMISGILELFAANKMKDSVLHVQEKYLQEAFQHLEAAGLSPDGADRFRELARFLMSRTY